MAQPTMKSTNPAMEYKPEKSDAKEFRPSVRLKERQSVIRQKLRIKDLLPDRKYIKDASDKELRYFLLISLPIVFTAFVAAMHRENIVVRIVNFIVSFFQR